ncbi:hypothetical protein TIFTF001_021093 [Ficus carica]|uniref:Uncharacterized protein n=1 Tax=Ficus carica TaxID=3494 RepID=A0AA88ABZ1_FICCA|nr:hypothetical protein TIFTF001_021093 [Ficus carica]
MGYGTGRGDVFIRRVGWLEDHPAPNQPITIPATEPENKWKSDELGGLDAENRCKEDNTFSEER